MTSRAVSRRCALATFTKSGKIVSSMAEVLVVDDDAECCRALVQLFERSGHAAHCVFGGVEALEVLQAVRFKLVLLDLRMPGIGGKRRVNHPRHLGPPRQPARQFEPGPLMPLEPHAETA